MLRRLLRLWMCWCIAVFIVLGCSYLESAFAQTTRYDPNILGVNYSVIAEWQWNYGGGPGMHGCPPGHVPYGYVQPMTPPALMEPFPPRKAKRNKPLKRRYRN